MCECVGDILFNDTFILMVGLDIGFNVQIQNKLL